MKFKNHSKSRTLSWIYSRPLFSKEFESLVMGYYKGSFDGEGPYSIEPESEGDGPGKSILIKCEGKSDEDIIKLAKKTSFLVTGRGSGDYGLFDVGYSVNWCSSKE